MTAPTEEDLTPYQTRAANEPRPENYEELFKVVLHTAEQGAVLSSVGLTFFADFSSYQINYNTNYPYPIASFRVHSGYAVDTKASTNWANMQPDLASGKLRVVMAYVVFVPGKGASVLAGLKQIFGNTPDHRVVVMIDMESGSGFAGPGNHSVEANQWAASFASWLGSWQRVYGYANGSDWNTCWPQFDSRIKRHIAAYNAKDPSPYGWQYSGGNAAYPSPAGYPRSCAPFGSYIDMNVIKQTIDQIESDFGITTPAPPAQEDDDMPFILVDPVAGDDPTGAQYITDMTTTVEHIDAVLSGWYQGNGVKVVSENLAQITDLINQINAERASRGWAPYTQVNGVWQAAALPAETSLTSDQVTSAVTAALTSLNLSISATALESAIASALATVTATTTLKTS